MRRVTCCTGANKTMPQTGQVLYIPHGGGPLPLLGDALHVEMVDFLQRMRGELRRPSAIVVISAHWEANAVTITSGENPDLIYDYYGFPPESYEISYPAPGAPVLALEIQGLLSDSGLHATLDAHRGFDHGLFVPLKMLYPEADIPCVQVSLLHNLDPEQHIRLGQALAPLMERDILVLGSGYSFHNLQVLLRYRGDVEDPQNEAFEDWLNQTCCDESLSPDQRRHNLVSWTQAPNARYCHPREEHLLPLHVCYGVKQARARRVFNGRIIGKRCSAFLW